jgi:hypothetical protein
MKVLTCFLAVRFNLFVPGFQVWFRCSSPRLFGLLQAGGTQFLIFKGSN